MLALVLSFFWLALLSLASAFFLARHFFGATPGLFLLKSNRLMLKVWKVVFEQKRFLASESAEQIF